MRKLVPLFLLSLFPAVGQPTSDLEAKITAKIQAAVKDTGVPSVSVAVVTDGKLSYAKAFGSADREKGREADVNTRYAVGSVSKEFTAAAILLAAEQGKLSLDDRVSKYFPDLTGAGQITIRQLLSHVSGYEDFAPQDYIIPDWTHPTTPRAVMNQWAKKPLNFDPGTKWQYSNTGYVVAGEIFEKASGRKLVEFLREKIFTPLGMASAGDCETSSPRDATAYTRYALGPARPVAREAAGWYFAAGELCMTASDLAKWDIAFLEHRILTQKSYEEFTREVLLKNGDHTHYSLGLSVGDLAGMPTLSHAGEVSGFLAQNTIFPTRQGAVILLLNQDNVNLIGPLSRQIAALVFTTQEPPERTQDTRQAKAILENLVKGQIDQSLLTDNAKSYFNEQVLADYRASLSALGELKSVNRTSESLRGGMTHRRYRAQFEKKAVSLNIYVLPDGRYEQFLVLEDL